ncbi:alpha/beta fold hydrolase [Rhizobium sp. AN80A]|uniref:alpha/beta fold hydrolase n=1 Tax=Rhizobium sp. AN80A TaxID=3040673 RepID=UPI0024B32D0E|nr:alpha/beta fold hydrolase [Rhizobium sp. AN80A]
MGGQIGYRTFGTEGDWLVLIHGWCGNAEHWNAIAPELARDYRVLAVSHPGFGGMLPPPPAGQTIRAMGTAVAHLHPSTDEAMREAIADDMIASAPPTFALDVKDDLFAWDAEERWPLVTRPAVILNSTWVARLADPKPMACFSTTDVIEYDSGHFPMIEAPVMIVEKLRSCLATLVYA